MMTSEGIPELIASTRRIEQLLEILAKQSLRAIMAEELSDPESEALYKVTGTKTISEISTEIEWSIATISRTWTRWHRLGILVKDGRGYRKTFEDDSGNRPKSDRHRKQAVPAPLADLNLDSHLQLFSKIESAPRLELDENS
jgi:hypothetical protein